MFNITIYCVSRNKPGKRAALLLLLLLLQAQLPLLHHTWSDMAGHQKINLFPLHLFKTLLICCLPIKGLAPSEEPIERHESCETQANPRPHSNVAYLYQGATPFPDTAYLWPPRREPAGGMCLQENATHRWPQGSPEASDMGLSQTTLWLRRGEGKEWRVYLLFLMWKQFKQTPGTLLKLLSVFLNIWISGDGERDPRSKTSAAGERTPCGPLGGLFLPGSCWMCDWDLQAEEQCFPWIQTSRALFCLTTAWTNSPRISRPRCVSTRCPTLSTSSTRPWTASCRRGRLTASATSWAAPCWGWAPRAPPPCCPDTPPWGGSAPPSPARPCTITGTTTPPWAASPSLAPSAPWRVAAWTAGRRAAVTGEEGGSSAPTVSVSTAAQTRLHFPVWVSEESTRCVLLGCQSFFIFFIFC